MNSEFRIKKRSRFLVVLTFPWGKVSAKPTDEGKLLFIRKTYGSFTNNKRINSTLRSREWATATLNTR